jgi:hypothetical protein
MTSGARIDDGGKVPGKIVGLTVVKQGKSKRDLQGNLGYPDEFSISPRLTVNRDFATGNNCIQERLAVESKYCAFGRYAAKQWNAFPIGDGDLVDSSLFSI